MSPLEAIQAATVNAAKLIGDESIGRILIGNKADFIGLDQNPLNSINTLEKVPFVMKEGKIVKSE